MKAVLWGWRAFITTLVLGFIVIFNVVGGKIKRLEKDVQAIAETMINAEVVCDTVTTPKGKWIYTDYTWRLDIPSETTYVYTQEALDWMEYWDEDTVLWVNNQGFEMVLHSRIHYIANNTTHITTKECKDRKVGVR